MNKERKSALVKQLCTISSELLTLITSNSSSSTSFSNNGLFRTQTRTRDGADSDALLEASCKFWALHVAMVWSNTSLCRRLNNRLSNIRRPSSSSGASVPRCFCFWVIAESSQEAPCRPCKLPAKPTSCDFFSSFKSSITDARAVFLAGTFAFKSVLVPTTGHPGGMLPVTADVGTRRSLVAMRTFS